MPELTKVPDAEGAASRHDLDDSGLRLPSMTLGCFARPTTSSRRDLHRGLIFDREVRVASHAIVAGRGGIADDASLGSGCGARWGAVHGMQLRSAAVVARVHVRARPGPVGARRVSPGRVPRGARRSGAGEGPVRGSPGKPERLVESLRGRAAPERAESLRRALCRVARGEHDERVRRLAAVRGVPARDAAPRRQRRGTISTPRTSDPETVQMRAGPGFPGPADDAGLSQRYFAPSLRAAISRSSFSSSGPFASSGAPSFFSSGLPVK